MKTKKIRTSNWLKTLLILFVFQIFSSTKSLFSQGLGIDAATPATKLDVNGDMALRISSFTAVTGDNNNINIGNSSFVRISGPTGNYKISGIAGGVNGKIVILYNATDEDMTLEDQTTTSIAANRIICSNNSDGKVKKNGCAILIYSSIDSRWIVASIWKN